MSFPRYPEYKDSELEHIGRVPSHWEVTKLPWLICSDNAGEVIDKTYWGKGCEWLYTCAREPMSSDFKGFPEKKRTLQNDLLLTRNGTPYIHEPEPGSIYSNVVQRISLESRVNRRFLRHGLDVSSKSLVGYGVSIASFNYEMWSSLRVVLPNKEEQDKIVAFLDHETARIDALVEEQQRLIELLKEKRQAVISHAVTKGLDPDVPMKDSGVEWLGEVPEHWEVTKLSYITNRIGSGKTPSGGATAYVSSGVPFIRSQNVHDHGLRLDDVVYIDEATDREMAWSRVKPLDVLINITGASIGRSCQVPAEFGRANVNQHVCVIRLDKAEEASGWVAWAMKAPSTKEQVKVSQTGAAREGLNFEQLAGFYLCMPPHGERKSISSFLDQETVRIDALLDEADSVIKLLQERRSALISAAVTGKIDVRGWQPPAGSSATAEISQTEAV